MDKSDFRKLYVIFVCFYFFIEDEMDLYRFYNIDWGDF